MTNEQKFREFLDEIYGKHITDSLLDKKQLTLIKGDAKDLYHGNLDKNKLQVIDLLTKLNHTQDFIKQNEWAFDFPGWIGELDLSAANVKDILVIGMEPHIGEIDRNGVNRTAQVTYGLRETADNIFADLDNEWLLNNLKNIFTDNSDYYTLEKFKESSIANEFLNRIYITDMSPFAMKGKANQMTKIEVKNHWSTIRKKVAEKYISETINFIKPKYIVSQGNVVGNFIDEVLEKIGKNERRKEPEAFKDMGKYTKLPLFKFFEYKDSNIVHLRLPHLASGQTTDFWLPNIKRKGADNDNRSLKREERMSQIRNKLFELEKSI